MKFEDTTIRAERLVLEKMTRDDAAGIYAYASDPLVARYVVWDSHRGLDDTHAYIRSVMDGYERGELCDWVIRRTDTRAIIGTCGFVEWNRIHARAEIGYVIARLEWNRGYATEAAGAVIGFGFGRMGLRRIEAQCMPDNAASERVMRKLGMRSEGVLRKRVRAKDAHHDVWIFSLLREEFTP